MVVKLDDGTRFQRLRGRSVPAVLRKRLFRLPVAVAMNAAPAFLERGKKRSREWLQVRAFLFKAGRHLFARRAMDARVGDAAFPVAKEEVFLVQGLEATAHECIGANVSDSPAPDCDALIRRWNHRPSVMITIRLAPL
jgi:hypothetical protein